MFYSFVLVTLNQLFVTVLGAQHNLTTVVPHALMSRLDGKNSSQSEYIGLARNN